MTNLDLKVLLFFLASYKTLALCGHPVIEKMQKILLYETLFAFFVEKKLVTLTSRLRWEEVRAILEGFINLGHRYSSKSWLCSCGDEFCENSKVTGPGLFFVSEVNMVWALRSKNCFTHFYTSLKKSINDTRVDENEDTNLKTTVKVP